jgi:TPP-dependent pyruvate/acetoin dehydrogenase alpha subunit
MTEAQLDTIESRAAEAIEHAAKFAKESPDPDLREILTDVYVDYPEASLWPFQTAPQFAAR